MTAILPLLKTSSMKRRVFALFPSSDNQSPTLERVMPHVLFKAQKRDCRRRMQLVKQLSRQLRCELCGSTPPCGMGTPECWCSNIALSPEASASLRNRAKDCVCPECLTKFASKT